MLKLELSTLDGLPADISKEYKAKAGGGFILDTDKIFEDVTPLKSTIEHEKANRKAATERATALEAEVATLKARGGDPTELEKSWQKKHDDAVKAEKETTKRLRVQLETVYVDNVARDIATEVSKAPVLLIPHIKSRLVAEEQTDGTFITRVLDTNGKPSAANVNDFKAEIIANPNYASIIVASRASGGGAQGGAGAGAGGKKFSELTEPELVQLFRTNRPEYDRLKAAETKKV